MLKIVRLTCLILLFSAIMFPAYASASTGHHHSGDSEINKKQTVQQLISFFSSYDTNWNWYDKDKDWDDIKWDDFDYKESHDIWKKWLCY